MSWSWKSRRVLVLGAGRTGVAVANFLCARGARVVVADRKFPDSGGHALPQSAEPISEATALDLVSQVELVIPSPGVAPSHPVLRRARECHTPVWSEIELAFRELHVPLVAITGTNGKSTTTVLVGEILRAAGHRAFVGGNLGTPLIEAVDDPNWTIAVAEVSSFQLEWVEMFRPRVGVFLNLTPDHLDRYADLDAYGEAKMRLFARQDERDVAVLNRDDPWIWSHRREIRAVVRWFSLSSSAADAFADGTVVTVRGGPGSPWRMDLAPTALQGVHNRENAMAALLVARELGVSMDAASAALASVRPLPHRLEFVREWHGVRFYDDSKGTNVGAVEKSLLSFPGNIVLLAGGYDKQGDFRSLVPLLRERVRYAVFFGAAGPKWAQQVGANVPHTVVSGLKEAVREAARVANPGDVVLLSPGCASFDEFTDYADRGRAFRTWVEEL